jgi:phosphopantetheinyl transferase
VPGQAGGSVIVIIATASEGAIASALMASWLSGQDRADVGPGRHAGQSLLARAALRALLAQTTGRTDWRIVRSALGKPAIVAPSGAPGPAVSLSHSGSMAAVAMARTGAIGIDIEQHRPRNFAALAAAAFGPLEQAEAARDGAEGFYRIWTLREAMAKATGEGLALAANGRDVVDGGVAETDRRIVRQGRNWWLAHRRIYQQCSLAVAHAGAPDGPWGLRWCDLAAVGDAPM